MRKILETLSTVEDWRQEKKVRHKLSDIIAIVLFASLANANEWMEIYYFAKEHEAYLHKYLELPNGIQSHDTIQRVFAMVSPEFLQQIQTQWNEMLTKGEGEKLRRILAIDGKAQRGTATGKQKANHIISAVDENGFCLGQNRVDEKSDEITAIPKLLETLKATPYNGVQEIRHLSKWINGEKNNQISCVKASQIRQSGKACPPESGLLTRTSYSIWRFAFADLGIGSFGIEAAA